jgi:hypothetical protein
MEIIAMSVKLREIQWWTEDLAGLGPINQQLAATDLCCERRHPNWGNVHQLFHWQSRDRTTKYFFKTYSLFIYGDIHYIYKKCYINVLKWRRHTIHCKKHLFLNLSCQYCLSIFILNYTFNIIHVNVFNTISTLHWLPCCPHVYQIFSKFLAPH